MASMEVGWPKTQHFLKVHLKATQHAKFHQNRTSGSWVIGSVVQKTRRLRPPLRRRRLQIHSQIPSQWKSVIAVIGPFCWDLPRKYIHHRVNSVLLVSVCKWNDLDTKREKCSVKKPVQQKHLTCKVKRNNVTSALNTDKTRLESKVLTLTENLQIL